MNREDLRNSVLETLRTYGYANPQGQYTVKVTKTLVEEIIINLFDDIRKSLIAGNDVVLPTVGFLKTKYNKARRARNPKNGDTFVLPAHQKVYYQVAQALKREIKSN